MLEAQHGLVVWSQAGVSGLLVYAVDLRLLPLR